MPLEIRINPPKPDINLYPDRIMLETTDYYLKDVVVWAPHLIDSISFESIKCSKCGIGSHFEYAGWATSPIGRYVHGINGGYYLTQCRYKCNRCSKTIYSGSNEILAGLNHAVRSIFPRHLSERSAVDYDLRA